ncbi:hypothetical protein M422DRAFT_176975 [Sphaerobolus stellatus SS14]|uniref:Uncharacterized protein n=1 Tax=Sphaerobolus stellatus (strain SS14) TaxID=990650 RepID=A0A0C9V9D5_SPHS4|nr:hypothetical protein M422DRAFT_176975 [Sphaerobolus stellatus SS14]
MVILDVWTRWASTHQMCECVLQYCAVVDSYVAKVKPLRDYEMNANEWMSIQLVTKFLKIFCTAITQMSAIKKPLLSTAHTIFKGLQDDLAKFMKDLPNDAPPKLMLALLGSHCKLSDYFFKFDLLHYIWFICE